MTLSVDATAQDQVYRNLAPFFLEAANNIPAAARAAAEAAVAGFAPTTTEELFLAAQIILYGLAGMDSLRRSAEAPDLPVNAHLRLRGNAAAMNRAGQQCRRALEQRRKATASPAAGANAAPPPSRTFTEDDLKAAISRVTAVIEEARTAATQAPAMNRKARRAAEREARRAGTKLAA